HVTGVQTCALPISVDDDAPALNGLEPIDAADQRRLPRARRPADHDALARLHRQVDAVQYLEAAEPFIDVFHPDDRFAACLVRGARRIRARRLQDRKSTRLNSSHVKISYAVFCLKKKMAVESGDLDWEVG